MKVLLNPVTMIAIYLTVWWVVLFAVLPLGSRRSHAEAGLDPKDGGDPGAPVIPNLKRKAIATTWVSAIVFAAIYAAIFSGWFHLPDLPGH